MTNSQFNKKSKYLVCQGVDRLYHNSKYTVFRMYYYDKTLDRDVSYYDVCLHNSALIDPQDALHSIGVFRDWRDLRSFILREIEPYGCCNKGLRSWAYDLRNM